MSQTYNLPIVGTDIVSIALKTTISDGFEAVRTDFSGTVEPVPKVAYQKWADTTTGLLKRRDSGNTQWDVIGLLNGENAQVVTTLKLIDFSATDDQLIVAPRGAALVQAVTILSEVTTGHSSGNEFEFKLTNVTDTLELFSATVGTFTTLGGVGGGVITLDVAYRLTPDQNATVGADDVLKFTWTKVGAPANVTGLLLQIDFALR